MKIEYMVRLRFSYLGGETVHRTKCIEMMKNRLIFLANSNLFHTFAPLNEIVAVVAQG